MDPENKIIKEFAENIQKKKSSLGIPTVLFPHIYAWKIKLATALIYDAVLIFHKSIEQLISKKTLDTKVIYCNDSEVFGFGQTLVNYIRTVSTGGNHQ